MAKTTEKTLERTYNVPLRKEYMKAPRWNRTKSGHCLAPILSQAHEIRRSQIEQGIERIHVEARHQKPPHHIKVKAVKDEKGVVKAELFDAEKPASKKEKGKESGQERIRQRKDRTAES